MIFKILGSKKMKKTALVVAISSLISAAAFAQGPQLEEVVVTAQKRAQSLQDVPIAISAFTSDDLDRINSATLADLQYSTPNLTVSPNGRSNASIGIRGVSDFSRNPGYDNRVGVYVDGLFVGRSAAANQATLDLERIEVLRGPQGTLFGKNTVAGAISLTTKAPSNEFYGFVKAEVGNYSRQSVTAMVNAPLTDNLFAKVMINDTQRDGHVKNLFTGGDLNGLDDQSIRLQLRYEGDSTSATFSVDQDERKAPFHGREALVNAPAYAPAPYEVRFDEPQRQDIELEGMGLVIDHELSNGMSFSSLTGYRKTDFKNNAEEDYTDSQVITSPYSRVTSSLGEVSEQTSQEFRWVSPTNYALDYTFGLYYFDQTNESNSSAALLGGVVSVQVPATVDVTSYAAYIHGNVSISEKLQFTGGVRYTYEEKDVQFDITDTTRLFINASYNDSFSTDDISPKLGLNYFMTEDTMVYVSYGRGFKSGGWNVDFVSTLEQLAFDDESVNSAEIGIKTTLWDGRARVNLAYYDAQYDDFQVRQFVETSAGSTVATITNAGEVTTTGIEADIEILLTDTITLWATYGDTDSTFDKFKNGGGAGIDFDGNKLADAPETTYSVALEARVPMASGEVVAQIDYNYRDDFYTNPNNAAINTVQSYDLTNARIGYEPASGNWSVHAWVKNLSDNDDIIYASRSFLGLPRGTYMEPRMTGLTVKYSFGAQ
jgi:iron complex outermembrane receptor protein